MCVTNCQNATCGYIIKGRLSSLHDSAVNESTLLRLSSQIYLRVLYTIILKQHEYNGNLLKYC